MVKKEVNSILLSAVFLLVLIYTKVINLPQSNLMALINLNEIKSISGKIISNPSKLSDKYYSMTMLVSEVCGNGIISKSTGKIKVLIPSSIVESYYPDKLYSKNRTIIDNLCPIENGVHIKGKVSVIEKNDRTPLYVIDEITDSFFEKEFTGNLSKIRAGSRLQFKRLMKLWGRAGGFLLALLSSSKEYLDSKLSNAFRMSGLSHILALSGMHLSLISTLAGIVENKSSLKKLGLLFRSCTIIAFVWFAGLSPSLLRALISCLIICICSFFNLTDVKSISVLALTFLIHASLSPDDLYNIGFLLSYSALSGIILLSDYIKRIITRIIPTFISESFSASIGANTLTSPISIKYFGVFAPGGIICTLFVSPLVTIFLYSGIMFMTLSFALPSLTGFSSMIMNGIYFLITKIVDFWSFIPPIYI